MVVCLVLLRFMLSVMDDSMTWISFERRLHVNLALYKSIHKKIGAYLFSEWKPSCLWIVIGITPKGSMIGAIETCLGGSWDISRWWLIEYQLESKYVLQWHKYNKIYII